MSLPFSTYPDRFLLPENEQSPPLDVNQEEMRQFQSTYFTVKELRPDLFSNDYAAQYIKVEGQIEHITPDMGTFTNLHKDLDTFNNQQSSTVVNNQSTTILQSTTQQQSAVKTEDLIQANKGVWDSWWQNKLKNNQLMINHAKKGNYEEVAKSIDCNYNDDQVASVNYQEPQTGFTALHYAVKLQNYALVNLLISNSIDVFLQDSKGQTALHLACQSGDIESYKLIVQRSYQAKNSVDKQQKTPLDLAYENKHQKIIEYDKSMTVTLYSQSRPKTGSAQGQKISTDDFEFVMPLGRGAFGEVVLVQEKSDPGTKYYAMKIMKKRNYNGMINFVLTEKEVQRKVRHRFIVRLAYAFQTFDRLFLISEYCMGGDMRSLLVTKGKFPESEARLYLAEALIAIEELQKNGIIHRDIKLDNILLDKEGHVKLTDFGLSKEGMFEKKLTNTILGGGRSYQLPEVLSEAPYDKSVDLYLFGLLAYELMTGDAAFSAKTPSPELEQNIQASKYRSPTELSPEARDLIKNLILSNPASRLTIKQIKKHPFFASKNQGALDWQQVSDAKLNMPQIKPRPIIKSPLPFNFGNDTDDEDDDYLNNKNNNESSLHQDINGEPKQQSYNMVVEQLQEEEDGNAEEFVFDEQSMNWVPRTVDVGGHLRDGTKREGGGAGAFPNDLFMSDTDLTAMKVPNFSFTGDVHNIHHK